MKKLIWILAVVSSGCSAQNSFEGNYTRINASPFEVAQGMNTGISIDKTDTGYSLVMHNSYGDIPRTAILNKDTLVVKSGDLDDLLVTQDRKGTIHIQSVDVPTKTFDFSKSK